MESFVLPRQVAVVVVVVFGVSCVCVCVLFGYNKIKWMFSRFFCYIFGYKIAPPHSTARHTTSRDHIFFLSWLELTPPYLLLSPPLYLYTIWSGGDGEWKRLHQPPPCSWWWTWYRAPSVCQIGWLACWLFDSHSVCLSQKMATDRTAENETETETFMHSWIKQNENCINKI